MALQQVLNFLVAFSASGAMSRALGAACTIRGVWWGMGSVVAPGLGWTNYCCREPVAHPKKLICEWTVLRIWMASEGASTDCPPLLFRMSAGKFGHFCAVGSFPVPPTRSPSAARMAKQTSTSAWCAKGCCEYRPPTSLCGRPAHTQHVPSCSKEPALGMLCLTLRCKIVVLGQTDQSVALQHTREPGSAFQLITPGGHTTGCEEQIQGENTCGFSFLFP